MYIQATDVGIVNPRDESRNQIWEAIRIGRKTDLIGVERRPVLKDASRAVSDQGMALPRPSRLKSLLPYQARSGCAANSNVTKRSNAWSLTSGAPNTRRETCAQVLAPPVIAVVWAITRSKLGIISRN